MNTLDRIKEELASVPTLPGVYLWKDASGQVIYVGKAKQLRARMRQYVNFQDDRAKIPLLVEQITSFEYIVTESEHESLVLEKNLINQYSPIFNADFKDDKSYPFIAITKGDVFPAIKFTREKHRSDTVYFGPYTDSRAARALIEVARKVVPICAATCADWRRISGKGKDGNPRGRQASRSGRGPGRAGRGKAGLPASRMAAPEALSAGPAAGADATGQAGAPAGSGDPAAAPACPSGRACFDCHVGIGPGACCGRITPEQYAENVRKVMRFLRGEHREFIDELTAEMSEAAANLDFERASRLKSRIDIIEGLDQRQHAVIARNLDADVIAIFREETIAGVQVLIVREGRVINSNEFVLDKGKDVPDADLVHNFLLRYYDATTSIPREVILEEMPEDAPAMEAWLTGKLASRHGAHVRLVAPERGEKHDLLEMAQVNAKHALMRYKVRTNYEDARINDALAQLESALALEGPPMRIECFDISTIHGSYTVASMVVFTNGRPDKNQYRRFKIKTPLDEANDFLSMREVVSRRYCAERMADERFGSKPDLIILDGGKPQLEAVIDQFAEMGVQGIALAGLAKRDEELFVPWQEYGPVVLPSGSPSLYLVKQVRDEAHRFAITFHRELRGKGMTQSILDEVAGIGPVRKKALLKHFKSFKGLRQASLSDIKEAGILPEEVAEELHLVLSQYNERRDAVGELASDEGESPDVPPTDAVAPDSPAPDAAAADESMHDAVAVDALATDRAARVAPEGPSQTEEG